MHLFVKGDREKIGAFVGAHKGTVKYSLKSYDAILLKASDVLSLDTASFITAIHFDGAKGEPLLSRSREHTRVEQVHQGGHRLPAAYTGSGVIVGVIDAGIELNHPDFQYANGDTRIIEVWDQTMQVSQRTPSYGYGQVWDSTEINDGICPHTDQGQWFGHGTNTAGIAAGDGSSYPGYKGIAPDAELIVVSSNFSAVGWTSTVADAVDYIFSKAEALGRPCVINASIGTYLGSHDGRDLATVAIEEDITAGPGKIMVCAAGNSGNQAPYHLGYEASSDTTFTWFRVQSGAQAGNGIIAFVMYGDVGDMEPLQFAIGADQLVPQYAYRGSTDFDSILNRINVIYEDTLLSTSGTYLGRVETYADSNNGTYRLQVLVDLIDSVDYNYRLMITASGRFDLWSANWLGYRNMLYQNLPTPAQYGEMSNYTLPDTKQSIVSAWACSDKVITVGNMTNRSTYTDVDNNVVILSGQTEGDIAANSSRGPARTGSVKPEVTAPGDNTLTAGAFFQLNNLLSNPNTRSRVGIGGMHHRAGGTSSASPVVAGIAALFLEKCPNGSWEGFKSAITSTTFEEDGFTGNLPNDQWGHGKIDALDALRLNTPRPALVFDDDEFCAGSYLNISLDEAVNEMLWNTGDTSLTIAVDESGLYFAQVSNEIGCLGYSDSLQVSKRPSPIKPSIEVSGNLPLCEGENVELSVIDGYGAYQWSNGSFKQAISIAEAGIYACTVSNLYHCKAVSDSIEVSLFPLMPIPMLHLQEDGVLRLIIDSLLATSTSWYLNDDAIEPTGPYSMEQPIQGVYQAAYEDTNGCTHFTDQINVYALGENPLGQTFFNIFPNPVQDVLNLNLSKPFQQWEIHDLRGRLIARGTLQKDVSLIDVSELPRGVYQLSLLDGGEEKCSTRIVK